MANIYEPQKKALDAIYPNLNEVVDFLSKKLKVGEAMPSGTIFSKVWKGKAPFIESQFKLGFSAAVNTGILLGMKGAKRSGFRKIGNVSLSDIKPDSVEVLSAKSNRSSSPPESSAEENDNPGSKIPQDQIGIVIVINDNYQLTADRYNWVLQKASGNVWVGQKYWPDLETALRKTASFLVEKKIKRTGKIVINSDQLTKLIVNSKAEVTKELEESNKVANELKERCEATDNS